MSWTKEELSFLRSLNTPFKIQSYLDGLIYNPTDHACSPRWVMITGEGHCLEGGFLAAAALELQGYKPLMVDLTAEDDDHHVITIYKAPTGWGSISKSNTTLLGGRSPVYRNVHELVLSYFDFYFNIKGQLSLYSYTDPINLNRFNSWDWRTSDEDLQDLGKSFNDITHYEIISQKQLKKLPKVNDRIVDACFLGANPDGLYKVGP